MKYLPCLVLCLLLAACLSPPEGGSPITENDGQVQTEEGENCIDDQCAITIDY